MLVLTFLLPVAFIMFCYVRILRTLNAIPGATIQDMKAHEPLNGNNSNNSFTRSGQLTIQVSVNVAENEYS